MKDDTLTYDNDILTYEQVLRQKIDQLQVALSLSQAENVVLKGQRERLLAAMERIELEAAQCLPRER